MHTADPRTMGTTGKKPYTVTLAIVRSNIWPSPGKMGTGSLAGLGRNPI